MTASFLPGMRHLVARELRSRGLSQNRISALMGVTQASVSLYLSSDSRRAYGLLSKFSLSRRQADEDSTRLADALQRSPVEGLRALNGLWTGILGSGSACEEHRRIYPSLSDCDFCVQAYGGEKGVMAETISEVAEAVSFLEGSPEFVNIMPEVSVNLACAAGEARSPGEVVAIPGRIVKVKDRAKAMLPPEPGASVHMSKILLLVRSRMPETRACINFRFDARIGVLLAGSGLRTLVLRRHPSHPAEDATVESLERKLKATNRPFDAIVDEGGSGIEPNVYLFGTGAGQVARMAIKLAEEYSAG